MNNVLKRFAACSLEMILLVFRLLFGFVYLVKKFNFHLLKKSN